MLFPRIFVIFFSILAKASGNIQDSIVLQRDLFVHQLIAQIEAWIPGNLTTDSNTQCRTQLMKIYNDSFEDIFDTWGHVPTGLLSNKLISMGDYDSCVAIKNDTLDGKYCKTFLKTHDSMEEFIRIGVCIPKVCNPNFIRDIFSKDLEGFRIYVDQCSKEKTFNRFTYICIGLGAVLLILIIFSSFYDYSTKDKLRRNQLFTFWSLQKNLKQTFDLSANSNEHFDCIDGIRVITMMWIMYYHTFLVAYRSQYTDFAEDTNPQKSNVLVLSGTLGVDTFFCISGFLLACNMFRKIDQDGYMGFSKLVVRRYLRLVPPMMAVIFAVNGLLGLADGSNAISFNNMSGCLRSWWINALMLQNYASGCYNPTWYISADFIFHFFTPMLICGFRRFSNLFYGFIAFLVVICIMLTFDVFYSYEFEEIISIVEPYEKNRFDLFYTMPHFRYMTWIIGVSFGYFTHKRGSKSVNLPSIVVCLGWMFALGTLSMSLIYPWTQIGNKSIFNAASYDSFGKVLWAFSICIIIFLCDKGYGGIINGFLSHPSWKPFSRLSYSMYLLSFGVSKWNVGNTRSAFTLQAKETIQMWWFDTLCTFPLALILYVAVELPVNEIQNRFFRRRFSGEKLKV